MSDYQHPGLKIDKTFQTLIPPLSSEEYKLLEDNLLREGCRDPICIWNGTIIDGHNRYTICLQHNIPFKTRQINLQSRHEVIAWICTNQIGRRNISEETRRYLIGKRYEAEKIIGSHNRNGNNQYTKAKEDRSKLSFEATFGKENGTARRLGKEYHLSHATIAKYGAYSRAIDALARKNEEIIPKILSGQTKVSQDNLIELAKLPANEFRRLSKQLIQNDRDFVDYATTRKKLNGKTGALALQTLPEITVKDMPAFDPDAEISSLSLTIPSWISSIEIVALVSESRETPVWCMVYDDLEYEHEADIFANQLRYTKPLLPYEIFMANIEAGNDKQLIIKDLVESYGLAISNKRAKNGICAIATLESIYDKYGFHGLDRVLRLCLGTWEGDSNSFSSNMLNGVARLVSAYGDLLKDDTFKDKVGAYSVKEIGRTAKERHAGSLGYAEALLIYYNKKMKSALHWGNLYSGKGASQMTM